MSLYQGGTSLNPSLKHAYNHAIGGSDPITPANIGAYTKTEVDNLLSTAGSKPKSVLVTLSASSWDSSTLTQTVTVTGVSATESAQLIQPIPTIASQTKYYEAGILCTGQGDNSLTFTASTVPTSNLSVYIVIQEVTQS